MKSIAFAMIALLFAADAAQAGGGLNLQLGFGSRFRQRSRIVFVPQQQFFYAQPQQFYAQPQQFFYQQPQQFFQGGYGGVQQFNAYQQPLRIIQRNRLCQ